MVGKAGPGVVTGQISPTAASFLTQVQTGVGTIYIQAATRVGISLTAFI